MVYGGQQSAVRPSGFGRRRRPRHLQMMQAQHGMATQSVIAQKDRQQQEEQNAFNREQATASLALQQEQADQAKDAARDQRNIGYASTGVDLLSTIMNFF